MVKIAEPYRLVVYEGGSAIVSSRDWETFRYKLGKEQRQILYLYYPYYKESGLRSRNPYIQRALEGRTQETAKIGLIDIDAPSSSYGRFVPIRKNGKIVGYQDVEAQQTISVTEKNLREQREQLKASPFETLPYRSYDTPEDILAGTRQVKRVASKEVSEIRGEPRDETIPMITGMPQSVSKRIALITGMPQSVSKRIALITGMPQSVSKRIALITGMPQSVMPLSVWNRIVGELASGINTGLTWQPYEKDVETKTREILEREERRYQEKIKAEEQKQRSYELRTAAYETLIAKGKRKGKIKEEGGELLVSDEKLLGVVSRRQKELSVRSSKLTKSAKLLTSELKLFEEEYPERYLATREKVIKGLTWGQRRKREVVGIGRAFGLGVAIAYTGGAAAPISAGLLGFSAGSIAANPTMAYKGFKSELRAEPIRVIGEIGGFIVGAKTKGWISKFKQSEPQIIQYYAKSEPLLIEEGINIKKDILGAKVSLKTQGSTSLYGSRAIATVKIGRRSFLVATKGVTVIKQVKNMGTFEGQFVSQVKGASDVFNIRTAGITSKITPKKIFSIGGFITAAKKKIVSRGGAVGLQEEVISLPEKKVYVEWGGGRQIINKLKSRFVFSGIHEVKKPSSLGDVKYGGEFVSIIQKTKKGKTGLNKLLDVGLKQSLKEAALEQVKIKPIKAPSYKIVGGASISQPFIRQESIRSPQLSNLQIEREKLDLAIVSFAGQKTRTKEEIKQKVLTSPAQVFNVQQIMQQAIKPSLKLGTTVSLAVQTKIQQGTKQRLATKQVRLLETEQISISPSVFVPLTPSAPIPSIPSSPLDIPSLKFGFEEPSSPFKPRKRKYRYTPSFYAVASEIFSTKPFKESKIFTGLELRPIVRKRRKR